MKKLFTSRLGGGSDKSTAHSSSSSKGSPETRVARSIKAFCESSDPKNSNDAGDEVTYLPVIVEAAEASSTAAVAAAYNIRKLIANNHTKPFVQYNAIMLIRILSDNPGAPFTNGFDHKFNTTIQGVLRSCRDPSVQQLLRETLFNFEQTKSNEPTLAALLEMWHAEQGAYPGGRIPPPGMGLPPGQTRPPKKLPSPDELAARISEAKTSAQLLIQLSHSTPPEDVSTNELLKEFADRCRAADRNLHVYMNCTDPSPDEHTFATLIETCERLALASSTHQRAVLDSRRKLGATGTPRAGADIEALPTGLAQQLAQVQQQQQQFLIHSEPDSQMQQQAPSNPFSDDHAITNGHAHPPATPPQRQPYEYTDDDADLYSSEDTPAASKSAAGNGWAQPGRPDLARPTESYVHRQVVASEGAVMSGGNMSPPPMRVKDDD